MINVGISFIEEVEDQLKPMLNAYWIEADERNDSKPDIDLQTYKELEQLGFLVLITAFDKDTLVGILPFIESKCTHTGVQKAMAEMFYISPEYRGQGLASKMLKYFEEVAKTEYLFFTLKVGLPHNRLVLNNNYSHVENMYMKVKK